MERGVLICRTHHGFVCANAGVDASNVGAAETVTLLPEDPDRSAHEIRARIATDLGVEMAVIVSDSFGRPWRFGIVDVALGVAGFNPLDDQRGRPDADGRIMHATVVAVADEICSAAELASGKSSRRPLVLVRGAALPPGDGSVQRRRRDAPGDGPLSVAVSANAALTAYIPRMKLGLQIPSFTWPGGTPRHRRRRSRASSRRPTRSASTRSG